MTQNLQLGLGHVCVVELLGWVRSAPSFLVPHLPMLPSSSWSSAGEEGLGLMAPQAHRAVDLLWGLGMVRAPWPGGHICIRVQRDAGSVCNLEIPARQ